MNFELGFVLDVLILALASITSLFVVFRDRKNILLFVVIPIIVLAAIHSFYSANSLRGLSRSDFFPNGEISVLAITTEKESWIHIWYFDNDIEQPRAIKIPKTEENMRRAKIIAGRLREGQQVFAEFKEGNKSGKANGAGNGPKTKELIVYDFSTRFSANKNR